MLCFLHFCSSPSRTRTCYLISIIILPRFVSKQFQNFTCSSARHRSRASRRGLDVHYLFPFNGPVLTPGVHRTAGSNFIAYIGQLPPAENFWRFVRKFLFRVWFSAFSPRLSIDKSVTADGESASLILMVFGCFRWKFRANQYKQRELDKSCHSDLNRTRAPRLMATMVFVI